MLQRRREQGLLGPASRGPKGFAFDIAIRMGSGAYVCGEETALIESLEGQRGEPRNRPPFPIDTGFLGNPTIVNNVETFAWVTCVLTQGARLVQEPSAPRNRPAQALQRLRRLCPARRLRVPHGDHGGGTAEGSRRRGGQGGADRRRRRPVRPRRALRPHHRLRGHPHGRIGHRASARTATCSACRGISSSSSSRSRAASVPPAARASPSSWKAWNCCNTGVVRWTTSRNSATWARPCNRRRSAGWASRPPTRCCRSWHISRTKSSAVRWRRDARSK